MSNESTRAEQIDAAIGRFGSSVLRFCKNHRSQWWWAVPVIIMLLSMLFNSGRGVISGFWLLVVSVAFHIYQGKKRGAAPALEPTVDEEWIAHYRGVWRKVAINSGLAKKAPPQQLTYWQAARKVHGVQPSLNKQIEEELKDPDSDLEVPRLLHIERTPLGYTHTVALLVGQTWETIAKQSELLADQWGEKKVRITAGEPGQALITPITIDPMENIEPMTLENYQNSGASVDSVQIGLLEDGTPWNFPLGVHSIVAGNSGGGKSVAYRAILAQMATVPELAIVGIDLKRGVEQKPYRPRLTVGAKDMEGAIDVLRDVWNIYEERMDFLEKLDLTDMKDYGFSVEHPRIVVVIDECSELYAIGEPDKELARQGKEASALVAKLLRLVRAAGITVIMATQRPSTEVVPSGVRALTQNRVAFRMMDSSGAIMALGELPGNAISPVDIPEYQKGRAVVTDDKGNYSFAQCRYIDPVTAKTIAEETAHLTIPLSALLPKPEVQEEDDNYVYEGTIDEY